AGVGQGYVGQPRLTAQRFLPDVVAADGGRMYRTGDRVRWDGEGRLAFLGRLDRQVKVRGYRIEPGEVEAVLEELPGVSQCVVMPRGEVLVAYYTTASGAPQAIAGLREHLGQRLPGFMVPAALVHVPDFPMTVNGKLDTTKLPDPMSGDPTGPAPEGPVETLIADVWGDVLDLDQVSADDDFFALGGHSLLALEVVARVGERFGVTLRTQDVYSHPVLRDLAARVTRQAGFG
ncbi:phosphopantetheine-binding protein, partial [Microbispora amethystogenes]|uniref:phosphopantetheine-binding protein n=1 Tax=Microbispora amethystogenes TaxID=1427754 RepID=UPI0033C95A0D